MAALYNNYLFLAMANVKLEWNSNGLFSLLDAKQEREISRIKLYSSPTSIAFVMIKLCSLHFMYKK